MAQAVDVESPCRAMKATKRSRSAFVTGTCSLVYSSTCRRTKSKYGRSASGRGGTWVVHGLGRSHPRNPGAAATFMLPQIQLSSPATESTSQMRGAVARCPSSRLNTPWSA